MDLLHPRCAGLDVSKRDAKACVRLARPGRAGATSTVTTWSSMTRQVLALREHLIEQQVTLVVMEATGDYWKPFYYLLEDAPFEVLLVNARQVKNVPGRKTDVSDATWLAQLGAHGLVRGSFVPPQPVRELRDLTRTRTAITRERTREWQRLEKLLEDAGVKLTSVATDISGASGRAMLAALIDGVRDPALLADLARARLRDKIPALTEALTGRFSEHHAFLAQLHLTLIDQHTRAIDELTGRIEVVIEPFRRARELIVTVPGISTSLADIIIAETGADMSRFPTAGHLASWAGTTPGSHESAGRVKSTKTRPGNPYLKGALGIAALSVARSKQSTRLAARYRRVASRRGPMKALVAIEHTLLTAILAHDQQRRRLRRPRRRLLHPTQPRQDQATSAEPTATTGLRGHPEPVACSQLSTGQASHLHVSQDSGRGRPIPPLVLTTVGTGVGGALLALVGLSGLLPFRVATGSAQLGGHVVPWWLPMLLLVLVTAALAYVTGIMAVRRLGSSVASFVALVEVLFAVAFAALLLGQHPSGIQFVGGALILAGIAAVQAGPMLPRRRRRIAEPPNAL